MLNIIPGSHLDHALTMEHLRFILAHFGDRTGFFAETVVLPPELPKLTCALRGPAVHTPPVLDCYVVMRPRPGRVYLSRMLPNSWAVLSQSLTVIAGPVGDLPCVLFTAYGGPLAPREPGDPSLPESERAASEAFWREHALVAP